MLMTAVMSTVVVDAVEHLVRGIVDNRAHDRGQLSVLDSACSPPSAGAAAEGGEQAESSTES
ncbi:hypothetical protein JHV675_54610 [Mycobacterium avium subsp. hominissuis]